MEKQNITLIGMPASGKSTVGRILAEKLGYSFVDVDDVIEEKIDKPLGEFLQEVGDDGFRKTEEETIIELGGRNHVFAPGGSCIYSKKAMKKLVGISVIVYLDALVETLKDRIGSPTARGVVGAHSKTLEDLYAERIPLYKKYADVTVQSNKQTPEEVVEEIKTKLKLD